MSDGTFTEREASINFRQILLVGGVVLAGMLVMLSLGPPQDKSFVEQLTTASTTPSGEAGKNAAIPTIPPAGADAKSTTAAVQAELEQLRNEVHSERAIQAARRVAAKDKLREAREQLEQLQTLEAAWSVKWSGLLTNDAGRRAVANPTLAPEVINLAKRVRPTESQITVWREQLQTLARPIEFASSPNAAAGESASSPETPPAIASQHEQLIADLGKDIAEALAELKGQQAKLLALLSETANLAPGNLTLAEAIAQHDRTIADNRAKAVLEAQAQAEQKHVERIAQLEREKVEGETKRAEDKARAEEESRAQSAKLELDKIKAETRVREAQALAEIARLDGVVSQAKAALAKAQLEREFARDLPMVQQYLSAFMADGYELRPDRTKGPASLSTIEGLGGLAQSKDGLLRLYNKCFINNSRSPGAVIAPLRPELFGSLEKCQGYLIKYGPLMVERGLLAP